MQLSLLASSKGRVTALSAASYAAMGTISRSRLLAGRAFLCREGDGGADAGARLRLMVGIGIRVIVKSSRSPHPACACTGSAACSALPVAHKGNTPNPQAMRGTSAVLSAL